MLKIFFRFLFIFSLITFSIQSYAVTVTDLYTGVAPVDSESSQAQNKGFQAALQQVLVKVSGNTQVLKTSAISNVVLNSATTYVKEFSYNPSTIPGSFLLNVSFQPKAINELLQQNHLPIWGTNRPLLVVWIANTQGGQTQLVGTPSATLPWVATLLSSAGQRGLPIALPLLDPTDLQAVTPTSLQQMPLIQNASNRYNADGFIILQINQTNPAAITTQWSFNLAGKNNSFTLSGNDLNNLMSQGINQITNQLAQQFSVTANTQTTQTTQLQINGLNSVTQYAEIDHYLRSLTGVTNITLVSLSSSQAIFNLTLSAPLATIQQQLNLSHLLTVVPTPPVPATTPVAGATATPDSSSNPQLNILTYQYSSH